MGSPQEIVEIVMAVQEAVYKFYLFSDSNDDRVCQDCQLLDGLYMTRREIEARFPYLEKQSDLLWLPHVHPNCRCELRFEEEEKEEDVLKDARWKR